MKEQVLRLFSPPCLVLFSGQKGKKIFNAWRDVITNTNNNSDVIYYQLGNPKSLVMQQKSTYYGKEQMQFTAKGQSQRERLCTGKPQINGEDGAFDCLKCFPAKRSPTLQRSQQRIYKEITKS